MSSIFLRIGPFSSLTVMSVAWVELRMGHGPRLTEIPDYIRLHFMISPLYQSKSGATMPVDPTSPLDKRLTPEFRTRNLSVRILTLNSATIHLTEHSNRGRNVFHFPIKVNNKLSFPQGESASFLRCCRGAAADIFLDTPMGLADCGLGKGRERRARGAGGFYTGSGFKRDGAWAVWERQGEWWFMIRIVHEIRGRIRFRIDALRDSPSLCLSLEKDLARHAGITRVSARVATGSLLVWFDDRTDSARVLDSVEDACRQWEAASDRAQIDASPVDKQGKPDPSPKPLPAAFNTPPRSWHCLSLKEVASSADTSPGIGLHENDVLKRRTLQGENLLPGAAARSFGTIVKGQLFSAPVLLIGGAAGLSFFTGRIAGGILGLTVSVINAAIGSFMEMRTERLLKAARRDTHLQATVLREGLAKTVYFEEIVVGDILLLAPGARVPADARVIQETHLGIDESALTGESVPVFKSARPMGHENIPITERQNMVYRGTLVVEGQGQAVAVAVGRDTGPGRGCGAGGARRPCRPRSPRAGR